MGGKLWVGLVAMVVVAALAYWLAGGDLDLGREKLERKVKKSAAVISSVPDAPEVAVPVVRPDESPAVSNPPVAMVPVKSEKPVQPVSGMEGKAVPKPIPQDDPAREEADAVALNIRQFRLRFGGNPVGTNAEIVKELDGGNAKSAKYLPQELKRLNDQGELIDSWGTPYFFHQLSAEEMETRSAGPDKELWTPDDVVSK
jgi:hypothetical protein